MVSTLRWGPSNATKMNWGFILSSGVCRVFSFACLFKEHASFSMKCFIQVAKGNRDRWRAAPVMWTEGDLGLSLHSPQRSLQSQAVRQRKRPCAQKNQVLLVGLKGQSGNIAGSQERPEVGERIRDLYSRKRWWSKQKAGHDGNDHQDSAKAGLLLVERRRKGRIHWELFLPAAVRHK